MHRTPALCVFCGASSGIQDSYRQAAEQIGQILARRNIGLVYGGGSVGLMGSVANATLAAGGEVCGIIPQSLFDTEVGHPGLTRLEVVPDMHARKAMMASLADGFIALPGGIGTFEELFEVWTWAYLGYHNKPVAVLNVDGFYDPLLKFLDHTRDQGFLRSASHELLIVDTDPERLIERVLGLARQACKTLQTDRI